MNGNGGRIAWATVVALTTAAAVPTTAVAPTTGISCYPNHSLGQADDWMAEIYERWVVAHGVIILALT